ncbi:MAG: glyoxalase/bleomycin resistance/extradiol dioxygenase family protein, partial [Fuerstiella sp.]|nr:glyoxalase/bleomycin resistance/extradiol dioxygenase family protein [Fuerstiella sp.]
MSGDNDRLNAARTSWGILETVVYCRDLPAARRFYEGVLQLSLASSEPGRHLFFQLGDGMLLVFNPDETARAAVSVGDQAIPQHGADGPSHFAFRVDPSQLDEIRQRLRQQDVAIEAEIEWPGGGSSVYCRDPAGNSVEFATRNLWFD